MIRPIDRVVIPLVLELRHDDGASGTAGQDQPGPAESTVSHCSNPSKTFGQPCRLTRMEGFQQKEGRADLRGG